MLTKEQDKRIINLYKEYYDDIKPLTYYVERKYHKFPKGLLKEYRDIYDHISRCYTDDATEELIEENIKKAEHHFERVRLDIYRYVCDYKKRVFVRWKRKYSKYDLQSINDGTFWSFILEQEELGEKKFFEGRDWEAKDTKKACDYLKDSFTIYDGIMTTIDKKRKYIIKAKFKYRKVTIFNQVLGFCLGVLASIAASWIWMCLLRM